MKKTKVAEIVLLASLINIPILSCFYFLMQYTYSPNALNSIMVMMILFIVLLIISLYAILKKDN